MNDVLGYSGRRCIVTGAASGMGEATTRILIDLGAEVHAVDIRKPDVVGLASYTETDLADPAAIARTVDAIGAVVNNLFNCAGLPNDFPGLAVMLVNFCGLRELTERVVPLMIDGAAISSIASVAGMAWQGNQEKLADLLATPDHASAQAWCEAHPADLANAYGLSKEAINMYTASRCVDQSRQPHQPRRSDRQGHPHQLPQPRPDRHADDAALRAGQRCRVHARVPEADRTQLASRRAGVATRLPR